MEEKESLRHWVVAGLIMALWSIPYAAAEISTMKVAVPESGSKPFAITQERDLARLQTTRKQSRSTAAQTSYELAVLAAGEKQWPQAGVMILESVQLAPTNVAVLGLATKIVFNLQDYEKAEEYLLRLIDERQRVGDANDREMASYMEDLAVIYTAQRRARLARSSLESSLRLREHSASSTPKEIVSVLYQLAEVNLRLGDISRAKRYLVYALDLLEASEDERASYDIAAATHNIGEIYRAEGRFLEAEAAYTKALDLWRALPEEGERGLAMTNRSLEALHAAMKRKATVAN